MSKHTDLTENENFFYMTSATVAMKGLMVTSPDQRRAHPDHFQFDGARLARDAFDIADAMLAEYRSRVDDDDSR